jgi:hypothetical protein
MSALIPDGYFLDDYLVWGDLGKGGIVGKGFKIQFPDNSASDDQAFIDLEDNIRKILGACQADERLQLQFYTSSDYEAPLARYEAETARSKVPVTSSMRQELVTRYRGRVEAETLLRTECRLYLSTKLNKLTTESGKRVRGFNYLFQVVQRSFSQRGQFYDLLLRSSGGAVEGLDDIGHLHQLMAYWSPEQAAKFPVDPDQVDWLRTIESLCRFSEVAPREEPDHGLFIDGHYYGVWLMKTMPRATWPHSMDPFFHLSIPGLRVVVNMQPLGIEKELRYEEDRYSKLLSNIDAQNPSLESEVGLDKHRERVRRLMSNKILPFRAQVIALVHDKTRDGLDSKMEAVRAALAKTGAEPYRPMLPTSTLAFFNCATPCFGSWVKYPDFWHKIDDINLANLWCTGTTPVADLDQADWIADGDLNNLMGGCCFVGGEPAHLQVIGTTGSGKSVASQAMVIQSSAQFGFIVVVDHGFSWERTAFELDPDCRPIVVRSNGGQTFNPFDTIGLPLSGQQLASAVALCHLLVGRSREEDKDKLRASLLAETTTRLYEASYASWKKTHPQEWYEVCREVGVLLEYKEGRMSDEDGFADVFAQFRDEARSTPDLLERVAAEAGLSEETIVGLERSPRTSHLVRDLAFSRFRADMHFSLFDLQDELNAMARRGRYHPETCASLASLLRPWLRDGQYGPVVDGVSTIDLGSDQIVPGQPPKVVYFDLSKITGAESELRSVAGFLITNQVRNHLMSMPRAVRKQLIIEEMTAFLELPDAPKIIIDFYERMRKYGCQVVSIFQKYTSLLEAHQGVAKAIIGNSMALMLLRNTDRRDLDGLGEYLEIPEVIKDKITSFPQPAQMKGLPDAHAAFVWVKNTGERPIFTVGRNYLSDDVLGITEASPESFERKRKALQDARHKREQVPEPILNGSEKVKAAHEVCALS